MPFDLNHGWPRALINIDLALASMSLHHVGDPLPVLAGALRATRPGGLLAVVEQDESLRFLSSREMPEQAEAEERAVRLSDHHHQRDMPHHRANWEPFLHSAGWEVVETQTFRIDSDRPTRALAGHLAWRHLMRLAQQPGSSLSDADQQLLQGVADDLDPAMTSTSLAVPLHVRGSRILTLSRRPFLGEGIGMPRG